MDDEEDDDARAANVASHYNARPVLGIDGRKESAVFQLKALNNWIKSILISEYTAKAGAKKVLDLCCGKGGDLGKWSKVWTLETLIGVDIADVSVAQAEERFQDFVERKLERDFETKDKDKKSKLIPKEARFYVADVFATPLETLIPQFTGTFDLVSCQFAFHYSFDTEARVRRGLENISLALREGGYFIGTIPNANWIVKKLRSVDGLCFGNSLFSITFEQKEEYPFFGHTYKFALLDAIDDCPEFLVHFPTLKRLAAEYGLDCIRSQPFHPFVDEKMRDPAHARLMDVMNVCDVNGDFSKECWEVAEVYMTFVFQKRKISKKG